MVVKLGDQNSHQYFAFKIGDKVRIRHAQTTGTVMAGNCYFDAELSSVFYTVKPRYGPNQKYRQGDLEPLQIRTSS